VVVLAYTFLGGLTSSIYNEVLQFFLIVFGFAPLAIVGVQSVGGWDGLTHKLAAQPGMMGIWHGVTHAQDNTMGIELVGLVMGLGFVLSFGYWCTDFLVVQRALASKDLLSAQRTPLIAAVPKMFFPFLVIVPGLVASATRMELPGGSYDFTLPMMLNHFYPSGMLGIGLAALLASFMSGMAGNVTAFNTVVTVDIFQAYFRPNATDAELLRVGKHATLWGVVVSVGAAFLVTQFNSVMDYMQLLFSFFNAPIFATFLLGMFWRRTSAIGAFWGLLTGIGAGVVHHVGKVLGFITERSDISSAFHGAIWSFAACFVVTWALSLVTPGKDPNALKGLVYGLTPQPLAQGPVWARPKVAAIAVLVVLVCLNLMFA
jgi:SSS family solute:Na+ symporter